LTQDTAPEVRDWATFALGTQIDLDTSEIRDALAARLNDPDEVTRAEAATGLSRRGLKC
jgi:HEAT repeat protein